MAGILKALLWAMGLACVVIGLYHWVGGVATVPGETRAGPTVDSRERFYNAIFVGYGLAWLWTARQPIVPSRWVRVLASVFLLGGLGRVLSLVVHGQPHWFQIPLLVIELALPPVLLWLANADERAHEGEPKMSSSRTP